MARYFLPEGEVDEAEATLYSDDDSVLVNIVRSGWNEIREATYSCLVYARYEWQRVDDPSVRQLVHEWRRVPSRDGLPWEEALAYARSIVNGPSGI